MRKNIFGIYIGLFVLLSASVACHLGDGNNQDYPATEQSLNETQIALEIIVDDLEATQLPMEDSQTDSIKPTPTITPEWLVPQTSIYLTQIEMPKKDLQKPGDVVEFKIHFGNWSNVSIPPFNIKCVLLDTEEEFVIENIEIEPTQNGIASCFLKLPDNQGSYSIKAILDPEKSIENRENSEINMTNNGYIE